MLFINRLLMIIVLSVGITAAMTARAGIQLFEGSWSVKAFGNEIFGGTLSEEFYSAVGIPLGVQCNSNQPRCPFASTPTDGAGNWAPLGGSKQIALYCAPWYNWGGNGATARPAKGKTSPYYCSTGCPKNQLPIPPLYRNPIFFTSFGQPNRTSCAAISTGYTTQNKGNLGQNRGRVQAGNPVAGTWVASTTGGQNGSFNFPAVPKNHKAGVRTTGQIGEFPAVDPHVYRYTYATLRNSEGVFGQGGGPGSFNLLFSVSSGKVASINVNQGVALFGGTMRMLGSLTTKGCVYRDGGCSLGDNNWRYEEIGATVYTSLGGGVTKGYVVTYQAIQYHTFLMQSSTVNVNGSRFPWTTGEVTVTARGRGPHQTIHYAHGYDNRTVSMGGDLAGTIQLVSPTLTRWLQPAANYETAGIAILRIKFVPEPQAWAMLAAGISLLGVVYRIRGR